MKRYRKVAATFAALGAITSGVAIITASPAVAGPAGRDAEVQYLSMLVDNGVDLNEGNVIDAVEMGYALCVIRDQEPQLLKPSFVLNASMLYLCSSMRPMGPTPQGRQDLAQAQANLSTAMNHMAGITMGYIYVER